MPDDTTEKQPEEGLTSKFQVYVTPEVAEKFRNIARSKALRPHEYLRQLMTLEAEGRLAVVPRAPVEVVNPI